MSSFDEELGPLVEELEELLHTRLPEVCRAVTRHDPVSVELKDVLERLDQLERAIGLKTFELLRRQPKAAPPELSEPAPAPRRAAPAQPPQGPDPLGNKGEDYEVPCSAFPCGGKVVESCFDCAMPYCEKHIDPASHACGV